MCTVFELLMSEFFSAGYALGVSGTIEAQKLSMFGERLNCLHLIWSLKFASLGNVVSVSCRIKRFDCF